MAKIPKYFYFRVHVKRTSIELEDASDADVVEVVRCKDCKHWHREIHNGIEYFNYNSCDLNHGGDGHDFYCTDGEEVK